MVWVGLINCTSQNQQKTTQDWPVYGGNNAGNRYSTLNQITLQNVSQLQVAWTYKAAEDSTENKTGRAMEIQCQPIVVQGVLYGTSPMLKLFALDAATGKQLWRFDPFKNKGPRYHSNRGVMYWEDGNDKRILYTAGPTLYAIHALTGEPITSFGTNGEVDLHEGLGENVAFEVKNLSVTATSPGVIYKDVLVLGSSVSEFGDAAPGHVRGFDVRTGKLRWIFHTIPQPGEVGYETWPPEAYKNIGGANAWSGMVLDEKRGIVYMGTGSASFDFYGGNRKGQNLFANCILALNAETGKRVWHFQTVHHDLWDRDLPCPPNLVTVTHNGRKIDAVAQATKDGLIFLLDRDTGKPLFPVEERPVSTADALPGEHPWPTQPFPLKPAPFSRQVFTEADITDISPEANAFVKERFRQTRSGNKYMPPSMEGTLIYGMGGGAEWGGNAADPEGILYQNSNEAVWDLRMVDIATRNKEITSMGKTLYQTNCVSCHGVDRKGSGQGYPSLVNIGNRLSKEEIQTTIKTGKGRMPAFAHLSGRDRNAIVSYLLNIENKSNSSPEHGQAPEVSAEKKAKFPYEPPFVNNGWVKFFDPNGYPAVKPPWGTLNAIDLNTGEYLWKVPLGEFPELAKKSILQTGTENYGGPVATAGGLLFIGGTKDEKFRAFDKKTGKVVWEYQLPAGGFATPITYQAAGKQYVVIAAGGVKNGHKPGGLYMAFALPSGK
nr:PQQ-binding-like beta-propeller repeat protein [Rhodocytophaga rosea]